MELQLILAFVAFSVFSFLLFRFYVYRLSFQRISNYVQSKSKELENRFRIGVNDLTDVSVSMLVDVKKYEYLKDEIESLVDRFESKRKELSQSLSNMEKAQKRINSQDKHIEKYLKQNDERIGVIAKSRDEVEILKKNLLEMSQYMENFGKEKERQIEKSLQDRLKKIDGTIDVHQQTMGKKMSLMEEQLQDRQERILSLEKELIGSSGKRYRELVDSLEKEVSYAIDDQKKKIEEQLESVEHLSKDRLHVFRAQFETTTVQQETLERKYKRLEKDVGEYKDSLQEKMNQLADDIVDDFQSKIEGFQQKTIDSIETRYLSFKEEAEKWEQQMFTRESELMNEFDKRIRKITDDVEKVDQQNTVLRKELLEKNSDRVKKLSLELDQLTNNFSDLVEKNEQKKILLDELGVFVSDARQMIGDRINHMTDFLDKQRDESENIFSSRIKNLDSKMHQVENQIHTTEEKLKEINENFLKANATVEMMQKRMRNELVELLEQQSGDFRNSLDDQMKKTFDDMQKKGNEKMQRFLTKQQEDLKKKASNLQEQIERSKGMMIDLARDKKGFDSNLANMQKDYKKAFDKTQKSLEDEVQKSQTWWRDEVSRGVQKETEEVKQSLFEFFEKYKGELNTYGESLVADHRGRIEKSIEDSLDLVKNNADRMKKEISEEIKDSKGLVKNALKEVLSEKNKILRSGEKIAQLESDLRALEKEHSKNVKLSEKELTTIRDKIRKNINLKNLTEKIFSMLKDDTQKEVAKSLLRFQKSFVAELESAQDEIGKLKVKSDRHLTHLKKEIEGDIARERKELSTLKKDFQHSINFTMKDQKKLKSLIESSKTDMEELVSNFKLRVQDTEQELTGVVNRRVVEVDAKISNISEKVEGFLEETKVFEKANVLGQSMKNQIEDYEKKLKLAQKQNKSMEGVITRFDQLLNKKESISRLEEELRDQREVIKRLDAEGRQFIKDTQQLEGQMKTIGRAKEQISSFFGKASTYEKQIADLKKDLAGVNKKKDEAAKAVVMIQKWQDRLAEISENSARMSQKLMVDEQMENRIKSRLEELEAKSLSLQENYKDLGDFHNKYEQLDYLLEDMDGRMKALEEMRKKLILERNVMAELRKKFDEQIKIVVRHAYNQNGADVGKAPNAVLDKANLNTTISRLHSIGWSKKEIANQLGISASEVELILKERGKI